MQEPAPLCHEFLAELRVLGFEGDLSPGYADRTVAATDTSICQVWAGAVLYPRGTADLVRTARVTAGQRWHACGSVKMQQRCKPVA